MEHCDEVYNSSTDWEENLGMTVSRSRCNSRSSSPPSEHAEKCSPPPETVLLGLWPGARQDQIDYYVDGYQSLYPSVKIVTLPHSRTATRYIDDALDRITSDCEKISLPLSQDILVHLFGEDAAVHVCKLLRAYRLRTDLPLGVKSIVLDSVPVIIAPTLRSLRMTPEQLLVFFYLTLTALFWRLTSVLTFWFSEPYNSRVQRDLHDPNLLPLDTRKSYIFPEKDVMWAWDRPGEEDEICERREFGVRRGRVGWEANWSGDQERYWLGIENAWEGR